eukprot:COSAG02_NODE_7671_length_2901_cov_2.527123_2_plen_93_part_00
MSVSNQEEELEERRIAAIYAEEDRQASVLEQKILREYAGAELSSKAEIKEQRIVEAANRKIEQVSLAFSAPTRLGADSIRYLLTRLVPAYDG